MAIMYVRYPQLTSNASLATFQVHSELCLLHLDSYNNSLGENDKYLIVLAIICCILCIFGLFLALGILLYEKYDLHPGNRHLTDMVIILSLQLTLKLLSATASYADFLFLFLSF